MPTLTPLSYRPDPELGATRSCALYVVFHPLLCANGSRVNDLTSDGDHRAFNTPAVAPTAAKLFSSGDVNAEASAAAAKQCQRQVSHHHSNGGTARNRA